MKKIFEENKKAFLIGGVSFLALLLIGGGTFYYFKVFKADSTKTPPVVEKVINTENNEQEKPTETNLNDSVNDYLFSGIESVLDSTINEELQNEKIVNEKIKFAFSEKRKNGLNKKVNFEETKSINVDDILNTSEEKESIEEINDEDEAAVNTGNEEIVKINLNEDGLTEGEFNGIKGDVNGKFSGSVVFDQKFGKESIAKHKFAFSGTVGGNQTEQVYFFNNYGVDTKSIHLEEETSTDLLGVKGKNVEFSKAKDGIFFNINSFFNLKSGMKEVKERFIGYNLFKYVDEKPVIEKKKDVDEDIKEVDINDDESEEIKNEIPEDLKTDKVVTTNGDKKDEDKEPINMIKEKLEVEYDEDEDIEVEKDAIKEEIKKEKEEKEEVEITKEEVVKKDLIKEEQKEGDKKEPIKKDLIKEETETKDGEQIENEEIDTKDLILISNKDGEKNLTESEEIEISEEELDTENDLDNNSSLSISENDNIVKFLTLNKEGLVSFYENEYKSISRIVKFIRGHDLPQFTEEQLLDATIDGFITLDADDNKITSMIIEELKIGDSSFTFTLIGGTYTFRAGDTVISFFNNKDNSFNISGLNEGKHGGSISGKMTFVNGFKLDIKMKGKNLQKTISYETEIEKGNPLLPAIYDADKETGAIVKFNTISEKVGEFIDKETKDIKKSVKKASKKQKNDKKDSDKEVKNKKKKKNKTT